MQVTFEAVKEQLEILGHSVPDHVVRSFLDEMGSSQAVPVLPANTDSSFPKLPAQYEQWHEPARVNGLGTAAASRGLSGEQPQTTVAQRLEPFGTAIHVPFTSGAESHGDRPLYDERDSAISAGNRHDECVGEWLVDSSHSGRKQEFDGLREPPSRWPENVAQDQPAIHQHIAASSSAHRNRDSTAPDQFNEYFQHKDLSPCSVPCPSANLDPASQPYHQHRNSSTPKFSKARHPSVTPFVPLSHEHRSESRSHAQSVTARAQALVRAHEQHREAILERGMRSLQVGDERQDRPLPTTRPLEPNRSTGRSTPTAPAHMAPYEPSRYGSSRTSSPLPGRHKSDRRASASSSKRDNSIHHSENENILQPPLLREPLVLNNSFIVGKSQLSGTARKVDRVARYHQLNARWSKDKFLKNTGKPRKNQGFQKAYAVAHERTQANLEDAKNYTASERPRTSSYVAPSEKRRDNLRWQTRLRMQLQD